MKRLLFTSLFLLLLTVSSWATHNRAGEITYRRINGNTYEVTITTYTQDSSPADRCELEIFWGDGDSDTISRVNGGPLNGCDHWGEVIQADVKKNIYIGIHTYTGPGEYVIYFEDANRNGGVQNIPNSINVPFHVKTTLIVNPFLGSNSTPVLLNPPIDDACVGQPFIHNPGAYDAEGDSISYGLTVCLGLDGLPIPGYDPLDVEVNAVTGDFTWTPDSPGEYNFAMFIYEWREGILIGIVIRDMQITVGPCNNEPPVINTIDEICVEAGDTVEFDVNATDPNTGQVVTLTATGGPLQPPNNAYFPGSTSGVQSVTAPFRWITACANIQVQPHQVFFRAEDSYNPVHLVDYHTVNIYVIGPAPKNPQAVPAGNTITVSWDASECPEAIGYKIYRRNGFYGFVPDTCETGVPSYTGYSLVGTTDNINATSFLDDNNGAGLTHGIDYCYMIVACFPGGAEGYASEEVCAELKKDVPIITHVDVRTTDNSNGSIFVDWTRPTELDTTQIIGPYEYRLYRYEGSNSNGLPTLINTYSGSTLSLLDTFFIDTLINTEGLQFYYEVELFNATPNDDFAVGSTEASSVRLSIAENDRELTLSWEANVPWDNYRYVVYKQNQNLTFDSLTQTVVPTYTDTGLINGETYCYYIKAVGEYTGEDLPTPLINNSQIACGVPLDTMPPCPPVLTVYPNCDAGENFLTWDLPTGSCDDDAIEYHIYYTPVLDGDMELIAVITDLLDTSFLHDNLESIAGCYAITSMDSVFNESLITDTFCVENCPVYELPNVFTPDGDGINDTFHPFPYKFVQDIDIKIFNRWGNLVFETSDPDVGWDGTNRLTKLDCSDGVYYYVCTVNEIYLQGIVPRDLNGFIELIRGN